MTTQPQADGPPRGRASGDHHDLAGARRMRMLSIVLAMTAFAVLVVGFGLAWKPYYQVPAGLAAWLGIEWQRNCSRRITALKDGGAAS